MSYSGRDTSYSGSSDPYRSGSYRPSGSSSSRSRRDSMGDFGSSGDSPRRHHRDRSPSPSYSRTPPTSSRSRSGSRSSRSRPQSEYIPAAGFVYAGTEEPDGTILDGDAGSSRPSRTDDASSARANRRSESRHAPSGDYYGSRSSSRSRRSESRRPSSYYEVYDPTYRGGSRRGSSSYDVYEPEYRGDSRVGVRDGYDSPSSRHQERGYATARFSPGERPGDGTFEAQYYEEDPYGGRAAGFFYSSSYSGGSSRSSSRHGGSSSSSSRRHRRDSFY